MADFIAHFDVEDDDGETITRMGRLVLYDRLEGELKVKIDGTVQTHDLEQLNTIRWQKFEDDSQKEMFDS